MRRIYQKLFIAVTVLFGSTSSFAQVSVDPALAGIFDSKFPKEYVIADITVTGTKAFDPSLIVSISGLAVGDKVQIPGTDAFSKAITKLWKQNLISKVDIYFTKLQDKNLYVEIAIVERPRLANFTILGVKKGERDDLTNKMNLAKDRVVTENMILSAQEVIHKFFADKGYRNISVKVDQHESSSMNNAVDLVFTVDKGNKVKVNEIGFAGNENIPDMKLKKQLKGMKEMTRLTLFPEKPSNPFNDTARQRLSFNEYMKDAGPLSLSKTKELLDPYIRIKLFSSAKFSDKKFEEDKGRILDYYNSQGFRDAVILDTALVPNSKGNVDVHFKVFEGHRYYFGDITWRGNSKYSDSLLNYILGIKKGDPYNLELLNKRLGEQLSAEGGDIKSLYMDDGYLFFRIEPVETAIYNDTIDYNIRISEGPQANYGIIGIKGNDKTKDHVIRRELRTVPGEKFSRADIIRTQRELGQLSFFNPEKITPNVVPNSENGTVDITWEVEEKSADQLELSAGFGGGIGLTGTLGVSFNNFSLHNIFKKSTWDPLPSGDGQKLSIRFQSNGKAYRSYNMSFTEPWLGGKKRNSFTVSLYNTKYANSYDNFGSYCKSCGDTSYIKTIGVGVSLGKQLKWPDDYFALIYSLNLQQYKLRNYGNVFQGLSNGTSTNISLKIMLARSAASGSPIFPTGGSNFELSGQFTLPYSLLGITDETDNQYKLPEFHKWRFTGDWYIPIGNPRGAEGSKKQFILKASAKYGFIGRYNHNREISPFERFQLGDAGLSNNFALLGYDIIAHRGYPVYESSNPKVNPDNGNANKFFTIFNKYTLELRYPFSTNPSSTIYGLAFVEAANGWYKFSEYNPFKLRRSVGVGMRFFLPMFGLLGFDYGIGLDRLQPGQPLKNAGKFTFMLGKEPD